MATAWTATALLRAKAALVADSTLSVYVDSFSIVEKLRDDAAPDFTRHAIQLCPEGVGISAHTPQTNDETLTIRCRLWIACWTDDAEDLLTSNDTSSGLGAAGSGGSEVGMLQMIEDVGNCLRKTGLASGGADLVEKSALEIGVFSGASFVSSADRDRAFLYQDMNLTLLRVAYHDPSLR